MPVKAATLNKGDRFMVPGINRVATVTWVDQSNKFWTEVGLDGALPMRSMMFLNEESVLKVLVA